MKPTPGTYRVLKVGSRRVFAIPDGSRRFRTSAVAQYGADTRKKKILRGTAQWLVRFGIDRYAFKELVDPLSGTPFPLDEWMKEMKARLGKSDLKGIIQWPPQKARQRVYIRLMDADGGPVGFAKIALDEANGSKLTNEANTLNALKKASHPSMWVPDILAEGITNECRFLALSPLPIGAVPARKRLDSLPEQCMEEFAGPVKELDSMRIRESRWWKTMFEKDDDANRFRDVLENTALDSLPVCRVHGDLGPANVVRLKDGRHGIYDWESSDAEGPFLADRVSYWLGVYQPLVLKKPEEATQLFLDHFLSKRKVEIRDVVAALAFLDAEDFIAAREVIRLWPSS